MTGTAGLKLGFIGLGQMGRPIATNLLNGGATVTVSDRDGRWFEEFRGKGASATASTEEVAEADIVFLCLPNATVVQAVMTGLLPKLTQGQVVVDLSTISYAATVEIGRMLAAKGVDFLDAPISGMEARAIDGTLTVMCGGAPEICERIRPLLDLLGNNILFMGPAGSGQLTKLINRHRQLGSRPSCEEQPSRGRRAR